MKASIIEKLDELMPKIPKSPQNDYAEILCKRGFFKKDVLIYSVDYIKGSAEEKKTKVVKTVCSFCGGISYLEHVTNGEMGCRYSTSAYGFVDPSDNSIISSGRCCLCPSCKKGVTAIHIGQFKKEYTIESKRFLTVHNVEGHLSVLEWVAERRVNKEGEIRYICRGYEGLIVVEGVPVRLTKYFKFMSSHSWLDKWEYRKKYSDELYGWEQKALIGWNKRIIESTNCQNSALCEYMESSSPKGKELAYPARYIQTWLKYPQVENLVRQGYSRYVNSVFTDSTVVDNYYSTVFKISQTGLFINWKEKKPLKMLGLSKDEAEIAKKCTMNEILLYRRIRDGRGIKLTADQIHDIGGDRQYFFAWALEDTNGYKVPIIRTLNYLVKQKENHKGNLVGARYLLDYWNMLFEVYGSMITSELYPKDLVTAHDEILKRRQEKESAELQSMFDKRNIELEPLSFKDEELGLFIRPAHSQLEMINEGKSLHHCVAGYAKSHANGSTAILFIRKIESPEESFFTLEYSGGKVQQNRGLRNCSRTKEVKLFEERWLNFLKQVKPKGKKKNGQRDNAEARGERAGA